MTTRHQARQLAMQMLFRLEINPDDNGEAFSDFLDEGLDPELFEFACRMVKGTREHMEDIDRLIQGRSRNWDIKRLGRVERNVMRMAIWEMLYCDEVPAVVSINEAIDIAKLFGSSDSGKFVNGVLDSIRKDMKP